MAIKMPREAGTANRVDFRSLVYAASTHPQPDASFPRGYTTSERWSPHSQNDPIKTVDKEIIELFLEIEPRYSRTNRLLAEM